MQAGTLDQVVDIEQRVDSRDPVYLQATPAWSTFAAGVPCNIQYRSLGTPEPVVDAQLQSGLRAFLRLRYLPGVLPTMRVKHGTRYLQILDVQTYGRSEETRITALEMNEGRR